MYRGLVARGSAGVAWAVVLAAVVLAAAIGLSAAGFGVPAGGRLGVGAAAAHTDLLQGSPGPGQTVGGRVDFVDLVFMAPVSDAQIEVTGPDGGVVPGQMETTAGQIIRFRMVALSAEGSYAVAYRMVSDDGDDTRASYSFTFRADGLQPIRFGRADVPEPGPGEAIRWALTTVAVVALVALCIVLVLRLRRRRARLEAVLGSGAGAGSGRHHH